MEPEKRGEHAPPEPQREVCVGQVQLKIVGASLAVLREFGKDLEMTSEAVDRCCSVRFYNGSENVYETKICNLSHVYQADSTVLLLRVPEGSAAVTLASLRDASQLLDHFNAHVGQEGLKLQAHSVFSLRTEEASAKQYFQFYGYLSQQQNMMQDYIRTSTYQTAVLHNTVDFKDKVVLDVGAGTGVLSFFTLQGGARKVYAVEASNMATYCMKLVKCNDYSDRMVVLAEKIEEVELPEQVDVIISEPMGYMLFNERMLESYLHAKKWLKPGGKMYPTQGILYVAPFSDEALYMEQMGKTYFWHQQSFHGINVSSLRSEAMEEYFRQPIVDTFDIRILMSRPIGHTTDFSTAREQDLHKINIPLSFTSWMTGYVHGLAFWFDVAFIGSQTTVWLSTAPFQPLTHWYQVRLLLKQPLFVHEGQELGGYIMMEANERQSYDISLTVTVVGTSHQSSGTYDLKNPNFRYMSSPQPPPGTHNTNPTENYFDSQSTVTAQVQSPSQQTAVQSFPQVIRPANARGYPLKHSMGGLQTATEVIPVVNGSIISPAVQQQTPHRVQLPLSPRDHTHPSSLSHYSRHVQAHPHQQTRHMPPPHRAQPFSLQSMQTVPHSMSHHSGLQNTGYIDLGTGTAQSPSGHTHSNQYMLGSPPSGTVMYQKWPAQPAVLLPNLATHS